MKSASSTDRDAWMKLVGAVACTVLIVLAFYLPIWLILPDADPTARWAGWVLGYVCGCIVMEFRRWL